jgi:hypothetical protein
MFVTKYEWTTPCNIKGLVDKLPNKKGYSKSGVYCWGWLREDKRFVPYYIGKARHLSSRLFQHISNIKGGLYAIYSWDYMYSKDFKLLKEVDGNNLLYIPSGVNDWINVFNTENVQKNIEKILGELLFTWIETKNDEENSSLERLIYECLHNNGHIVGANVKGRSSFVNEQVEFCGDGPMPEILK